MTHIFHPSITSPAVTFLSIIMKKKSFSISLHQTVSGRQKVKSSNISEAKKNVITRLINDTRINFENNIKTNKNGKKGNEH